MTLSCVIPVWSGTPELTEMALRLAQQVRPMCDQLVISEDGIYSPDLFDIADDYLFHVRVGHAQNLSYGIRAATGDHLALLDSDIIIEKGSLRDLVFANHIGWPTQELHDRVEVRGLFIVAPHKIITEVPVSPDPGYDGIDNWWRAFCERNRERTLITDQVRFTHLTNQSYGTFNAL